MLVARWGLLALAIALAAATGDFRGQLLAVTLLILLCVLATVLPRIAALPRWWPVVEAAAATVIIATVSPEPATLLVYLIAPPLEAVAGLTRSESPPSQPDQDVYLAAHELLSRLRDVARALPTGLDEVSLGQSLLRQVHAVAPFERAGLYTVNESGRPLALTIMGAERLDWPLDHTSAPFRRVLDEGRLTTQDHSFSDPATGAAALLPLRFGDRCIGVIAIESDGRGWPEQDLRSAQAVIDSAALQLDTGRLFSDLRAVATIEERHRMAREIHDGVAQEVASLGYVADDIAATTTEPHVRDAVVSLRRELSRIVSELRLSIFDLRSDVQPDTGLGAALSSYVRQVGTTSGLTVHLVLDESTQRLGVGTETELLRIAQEAITNARRHSRAGNLWVTCRISPPSAFLRIADDGRGLGSPRIDSYGLEIMRERAARLGARLAVRDRVGGGTVVEVVFGTAEPLPGVTDQRSVKG